MNRFVPMVEDGSKSHTIRARRQKGFAKKGDRLYLYFGLIIKWCRKLREEICTNVRTIIITETDIYLVSFRLTDLEFQDFEYCLNKKQPITIGMKLDETLRNTLAWCDGFRPEGSTRQQPGNAFELMIRFWRSTHTLPFAGDLIDWKPTPEGLTKPNLKKTKPHPNVKGHSLAKKL